MKMVLICLFLSSVCCFSEDLKTVQGKTQTEEKIFPSGLTKFYLWEIYEVKSFPEKFTFTVCDNRGSVILKGNVDLISGKYNASDTLGKTVPKEQFKIQDIFVEKDKARIIRLSVDALLLKNSNTTLHISSSE
jgi:hypothetical protein